MRKILGVTIALICLIGIASQAQAAPKAGKANKATKERLVLMPLRVPVEDKSLAGSMEIALVEGLQLKYEVFSGEQVAQKAKAIFLKESKNTTKKDCDETRCMQDIAEAFQAELIATANVTKRPDGYFLALSVQNIFDNKVVYSKSTPCEGCSTYQVVNKLKELSGSAPITATNATPEPAAPIISANPKDPEAVMWIEAQRGNTLDDYQVYLDSYPKGKYIAFAKARIKKINDAVEAAAEQKQQQAWDAAQKENSEASYGSYLNAYPNGRFAGFAKVRLEKLKNDVAAKEEAALWNKADSSNDKAATEAYLKRYPTGRYVAAASAKLKLIKEEEAKGPAMVRIPGKNYEIGKYEVTQKEWRDVMGSNPSSFSSCGDNCPVEKVSWDDIQSFLQKLSAKTGRNYRLPTEAEWEYACYGGNKTEYCGGNNVDAVAWYGGGRGSEPGGNSNQTTHPVGQKQANGYGLYDMSGNVWEWMENAHESGGRALRGGSWFSTADYSRAAFRDWDGVTVRDSDYGFRLARTLP